MSETTTVETYTIFVNAQPRQVTSRDVSWEQVVDLAWPGDRGNPEFQFIVTVSQSEEAHHEGLLDEGGVVRVRKDGTVFNVAKNRRS